eukprot:7894879-Pyramimonas_sp.AAC.1
MRFPYVPAHACRAVFLGGIHERRSSVASIRRSGWHVVKHGLLQSHEAPQGGRRRCIARHARVEQNKQ